MLKKSLLMTLGGFIFIVGMILFPLPVPLGLPTMVIGLTIMIKASPRVKRQVISLFKKNRHSARLWRKGRSYQRKLPRL